MKTSFDWGTGFFQTLLLKGLQSFRRLITDRSYASAIRVYQIWAVRHLSTPWTGTQPKMKTKKKVGSATTAHLTSIPLDRSTHNSESGSESCWDYLNFIKASSMTMTSKDIFEVWIEKKWSLMWNIYMKSLLKTQWNPSKKHPKVQLASSTVTFFFRPTK